MPAFDSPSRRSADHDGRGILSAAAVAELRQLVDDLIEGRIDEVAELDLRHRPQPVHRHSDRGADDARLGQRRVDDAVGAELLDESQRGAEDAAELAHVLAQHHHPRVAAHLDPERVIDGLDDVPGRHQAPPSTQRCTKNSPAL